MSLEEKVAMEDQINELSHKSNCLLDIISSTNRNYRQKLFLAYRDFLERNIDVVNEKSMTYRIHIAKSFRNELASPQ